MKIIATIVFAALTAIALSTSDAAAFPGAMCFDSSGCSRCEVCVKAHPVDPSGRCMAVQGCY